MKDFSEGDFVELSSSRSTLPQSEYNPRDTLGRILQAAHTTNGRTYYRVLWMNGVYNSYWGEDLGLSEATELEKGVFGMINGV